MNGVYTAVTRMGLNGKPEGGWQPQQRIDVATALHGYTLGSAIAMMSRLGGWGQTTI